ncbi:MAG: MFS transporter [Clostridia bacterium]|nr:MFS transporter [Clostridia bacterium]
MSTKSFDLPSAKRSRLMYIIEAAFEYFVLLLIGGAYLAKLLSNMGIPDSTVGIISSVLSLAVFSQLISIFFVQKIRNVKKTVVPIHMLGQCLFTFLYLLPFLKLPTSVASLFVGGCLLIGYLCRSSVASIIYRWASSFVDPSRRASFSSAVSIVSLSSDIVVSFGASALFDYLCKTHGDHAGFLFLAILILVFNVVDLICLACMTNVKQEPEERAHTLKVSEVIRMLFSNKSYICAIFAYALWCVGSGIFVGFIGIYQIKELGMSLTLIAGLGIGSSFAQMLSSKLIADYTDKRNYAYGLNLGFSIAAVATLCIVFTTPKIWWMMIFYVLIYNSATVAIGQNSGNIAFNYVDSKYYVEAVAIMNSIGGICGFGASLIGASIFETVQKNGNQLFGIKVYGQQVLAVIAFFIIVIDILFTKLVLEKRPIIAK